MNFLTWVVFFSAVALVSSCSSDGEERQEYMDSYSVEKLEIPPELTAPGNNEELQIPEPSAKALAMLKNRDSVEGTVAPKFKGIELQSDGGLYWLLLNKDADDVWTVLREFLANEGIKIYRDEPLLGFIESEWIKEYSADADTGFLVKIFSTFSADKMDKFRLRLERVGGKQQTRLYVSHRGMEVVVSDEGSSWQQTVANQMLEKELLNRFVLFAGMTQEKADEFFAAYIPYKERIRRVSNEGPGLYEITGSKEIVWKRIVQAMDHLGVDIKAENKTKGSLEVLVGELTKAPVQKRVEKAEEEQRIEEMSEIQIEAPDESAESGWLMGLMTGDGDVGEDEQGRFSVVVALKESGNATRMQLSLGKNKPISSGRANEFRERLVEFLK